MAILRLPGSSHIILLLVQNIFLGCDNLMPKEYIYFDILVIKL